MFFLNQFFYMNTWKHRQWCFLKTKHKMPEEFELICGDTQQPAQMKPKKCFFFFAETLVWIACIYHFVQINDSIQNQLIDWLIDLQIDLVTSSNLKLLPPQVLVLCFFFTFSPCLWSWFTFNRNFGSGPVIFQPIHVVVKYDNHEADELFIPKWRLFFVVQRNNDCGVQII